jgi:hypothetical protein
MSTDVTAKKPFYLGTNFYLALLMLIGSFWALPLGLGNELTIAFTAVIAAFGLFREWLKTKPQRLPLREWLKRDANTWNYLAGVLLTILPFAGELVPALRDVVDAIITKQWNLLLTRIITLGTIAYYLFFKREKEEEMPIPARPGVGR